jgi:hypothetical protein
MKTFLFAILVSLSLSTAACTTDAETVPADALDDVASEEAALSSATCRDNYLLCLDGVVDQATQCACDNAYRRCMHRPEQMCLPE